MFRFGWEVLALLRLLWRYRNLKEGRVSRYALASMEASSIVDELRTRFPEKIFVWSFATYHTLDSDPSFIGIEEAMFYPGGIRDGVNFRFCYYGPLSVLRRCIAAGELDRLFKKEVVVEVDSVVEEEFV